MEAPAHPLTPHPTVPRFQRAVSTPDRTGEVISFADAITRFTVTEQLQDFMLKDVRPNGRLLGSGAYGSVEELEVNGVLCAGKKVHDIFLDPINQGLGSIEQKFVQECRIMSRLRHPHVVQFLGLWQKMPYNPLPVLVMEYLPITLDTLLGEYPDIPITMKVSILHDVAKGLTYLHECDPPVIHRDLTARNVLLNNAMVAKIADFGGSRIVNLSPEELSRMTQAPGNICFMPPEASGTNIVYTKKLDIFSFGVLALFTVTQRFPGNLHPATYADDRGRLIGRSEVERRDQYFEHAAEVLSDERRPEHRLLKLMQMCMQFEVHRPTVLVLLSELEAMRRELEESDPYAKMHKLDMMLMLEEVEDRLTSELREKQNVIEQQRAEILRLRQGKAGSRNHISELRAEFECKDMLIARLEQRSEGAGIAQSEASMLWKSHAMLQQLQEANAQLRGETQGEEERLRFAESVPTISEDNHLLLTRVQELERSLALAQQQLDSKMEELEGVNFQLDGKSGELRIKEDEVVALRMEVEQLQLREVEDRQTSELRVRQNVIEQQRAEIQRLREGEAGSSSHIKQQETKHRQDLELLEALQSQTRQLQLQVSKLRTGQEERDRKLALLLADLSGKEATIEGVQSEREDRDVQTQQKDDEIDRLEGELRDAQYINARIRIELQESRDSLEPMQAELEENKGRIREKDNNISQLSHILTARERELVSLRGELEVKVSRIKRLEDEMREPISQQTQCQTTESHLGPQRISPRPMPMPDNAPTRRFTRRAFSVSGAATVPQHPSLLRSHSLDMGQTGLRVPTGTFVQFQHSQGKEASETPISNPPTSRFHRQVSHPVSHLGSFQEEPIFPTVNYIGPFINQAFDIRGGTLCCREYGVSLTIPPATTQMDVLYVSVGCCMKGPFVMPKGYELVSPAYFVSPTGVIFAKAVRVSIHYWAHSPSNLHFMTALTCDGEGNVYHFQPLEGGHFDSSKGQASVLQFGWFAIARSIDASAMPQPTKGSSLDTGECGNEYNALLYRPVYHDNPDEPWPVVFSACLKHPACGTALKNHLTNTFGIDFMVTSVGVQLDGDITLEIPEVAAKGCGFEVIPDIWPCLIRKKDMDLPCLDFGSNADDTYPPRVHLTVNPLHKQRNLTSVCSLQLTGTADDDPSRQFVLRVPPPHPVTKGRMIQDDLLQTGPAIKDFMNMVAASIPTLWREVGCELGLTQEQLDTIKADTGGIQVRCFCEVFRIWKKETDDFTWSAIVTALKAKQVGHARLAERIKRDLHYLDT